MIETVNKVVKIQIILYEKGKVLRMETVYQPRKQGVMVKLGLGALFFLIALFVVYAIVQYFIVDPRAGSGTMENFVQRKMKHSNFAYEPWIYFLMTHISFGSLALILGPVQFSEKLRAKSKTIHRTFGKIYMLSILIAGIIGVYLSVKSTDGLASQLGFLSLCAVWLITTVMGFVSIRKREIQKHREWMLRSYAVTLVFITFRFWAIIPVMITGTYGLLYGLTIIYSWAFNLALVEWIIRSRRKSSQSYKLIFGKQRAE